MSGEAIWTRRIGWILRGLLVIALLADAGVALLVPDKLTAEMAATGFPPASAAPIGMITLVSAILYAIPRTTMLGAILVTGFVGGAICTHFRLGEVGSPPQLICTLLALLAWSGLYLTDGRVRQLLPIMR